MRFCKSFQSLKGLAVLCLLPLLSNTVLAQSSDVLDLADKPIFLSKKIDAKASIVVSISTEYPTTGAAYTFSVKYTPGKQYIGLFNSNRCYLYDAFNNYFYPSGNDTDIDYNCVDNTGKGNAFSGNFMNWATMSALDILRYSFTGGERFIDKENLTVTARTQLASAVPGWGSGARFPYKEVPFDIAKRVVPAGLFYQTNNVEYKGNLWVSNCKYGTWFSTGGGCSSNLGRNTSTDLNPAGGYTSRGDGAFIPNVVVCDQDEAGELLDHRDVFGQERLYCLRYPNGSYKPTGYTQQRYDKARFSLFTYPYSFSGAYSSTAAIMRSPLKYVGPTSYNAKYELIPGLNPKREWDPKTGIFIRNPEGRTDINQSGFTSALNNYFPPNWSYPLGDPGSEKYYQVLRYLQGMKSIPVSLGGTGTQTTVPKEGGGYYHDSRLSDGSGGVDGGLPFYTKWEDPHPPIENLADYSCIKNAIITVGDIQITRDDRIPGFNNTNGSPDDAKNLPDFKFWTKVVGSFETGKAISYLDNEGVTRQTTQNPTPLNGWFSNGEHFADKRVGCCSGSQASAGMAYWANTHDIRGKSWSEHSLALDTKADPRRPGMRVRSYFMDANEWDKWYSDAGSRNDNQYYYAGKYGGFDPSLTLDGSNPFLDAAGLATNNIWSRGEISEGKLMPRGFYLSDNAANMLNAIDQVFKDMTETSHSIAGFANSGEYETSMKAGDIVYQGSFNTAGWSGDVIASRVDINSENGELAYVDLGWHVASTLAATPWKQRNIYIGQSNTKAVKFDNSYSDTALTTNLPESATVQDQVEFLLGSHEKEGSLFRVRVGALGDIINSSPAYKAAPMKLNFDNDYAAFFSANKDRTPAVYVGANDGMLHAFNATIGKDDSGKELFGYIPSFVKNNLYKLTEKNYDHQAFVDATPAVSEAKINKKWKTVLVGGAGAGGQGVYALDITDPKNFTTANVMWEFTDADDPDLGNVMGAPIIVSLNTTKPEQPQHWFALVPGGVNNKNDDGHKSSASGPAIFILDLAKPQNDPWVLNTNYYKIILPAVNGRSKGIINLRAIVNDKMGLQTIYAGDLSGQLWKINLSKVPVTSADMTATRLFETPANTQSITMPVLVSNRGATTLVSFGTGKYLELSDNDSNNYTTQAIYTIIDSNEFVKPEKLAQVTQSLTGNKFEAEKFIWGSATNALDGKPVSDKTPIRAGWYFNLPVSSNTGERFIYRMGLRNGTLLASSLIPSLGECSSGSSHLYRIDLFSGNGSYKIYRDVIYGPVYIIDGSGQPIFDPDSGNVVVGGDSIITAPGSAEPLNDKNNKLSSRQLKQLMNWREITNYNQLRKQDFEKD